MSSKTIYYKMLLVLFISDIFLRNWKKIYYIDTLFSSLRSWASEIFLKLPNRWPILFKFYDQIKNFYKIK